MSQDYLTIMMEMQDKLNSAVGLSQERALKMSEEELSKWIRNYNAALQAESSEVWEAASGRWWRDTPKNWKENVEEEAVDCLHFLMSVFLLLGMDAKKVYEVYYKKNKKNFERSDWHHHSLDDKEVSNA